MEHRKKNEGLLPEPQASVTVTGSWKKGFLQVSGVRKQWRWMDSKGRLRGTKSQINLIFPSFSDIIITDNVNR